MILDVLVRNYYERNGNFDGITETVIGPELLRLSETTGETVEEIGYFMLGFRKAPGGSYKETAIDAARQHRVNRKKKNNDSQLIRDCISLACEYYKKDASHRIIMEDKITCLNIWILQNVHRSIKEILAILGKQGCLLKISVKAGVQPTIYGDVLYVPQELGCASYVQQEAIRNAIRPYCDVKKWLPESAVGFVSLHDDCLQNYLQIVSYCSAHNITVAQAMQAFRVNIPDLIKAFSYVNFTFITLSNNDFLICSPEQDGWFRADGTTVNSMIASMINEDVNFHLDDYAIVLANGSMAEENVPVLCSNSQSSKSRGKTNGIHSF